MNHIAAAIAALFFLQPASAKTVNYGHLLSRWKDLIHGSRPMGQTHTLGVINGGGASGMECVQADGRKIVRLLDMKELSDVWGLQEIQMAGGTDAEAMDLLADKMTEHFWNPWTIEKSEMKKKMMALFSDFLAGAQFLKPGQDLTPVDDVHTPIFDPNCKLVQLAMVYDESRFLIDTDLWIQLSALDRAALLGHELVYVAARLNGEVDSINTRKFVSYLFSTRGLATIGDNAPTDVANLVSCTASRAENPLVLMGSFFGYEKTLTDGSRQTNFSFVSLGGKDMLFRTDLKTVIGLEEWRKGAGHEITVEFDMDVDTFPWLRNQILIKEKPRLGGGVDREISYFNQNGVLLGGPWPLECY